MESTLSEAPLLSRMR